MNERTEKSHDEEKQEEGEEDREQKQQDTNHWAAGWSWIFLVHIHANNSSSYALRGHYSESQKFPGNPHYPHYIHTHC